MARQNLSGIFWLLIGLVVLALPLACGSSTTSDDDSGSPSGAGAGGGVADSMTRG